MAVQLSVAVRNARQDATETAIGASPKLQFRTGAQPANCAAAASGTLLCEMALPADWQAAASAGSKVKAGVWTGTGVAAGNVGHFRVVDNAGTNCHIQGAVNQNWSASTAYALNAKVALGGRIYNCTTAGTSASSGGPTGTGTGITDGTAVWAYVEPADLTVDNVSIAVGQTVTVNTFTTTDANA